MNDPESRKQARGRMALRAERAFGLSAVRVRIAAAVHRPQPQAPATQEVEAVTKNLFGAPINSSPNTVKALPVLEAFDAPVLSTDQKIMRLQELDKGEVTGCTRCRLHETRTHTVFGEGNPDARIFFIGEGPGENEDLQARPFVGRAGQKLNEMIASMGLAREQVYIANIVKCRPPGNREPAPDEVSTCTPYLERQLEIIRPKVIVTLGRPALQHMLQTKVSITRMRGTWQTWRGIKLMPTFHPAYILRNYTQETRAAVWSDLKSVMAELGMPVPSRGSGRG